MISKKIQSEINNNIIINKKENECKHSRNFSDLLNNEININLLNNKNAFNNNNSFINNNNFQKIRKISEIFLF